MSIINDRHVAYISKSNLSQWDIQAFRDTYVTHTTSESVSTTAVLRVFTLVLFIIYFIIAYCT